MKNTIEVCFSPHSFPLYPHEECIVVVIDVLRATSSMCTALHFGVEKILPVASVVEARNFQSRGFLVAAERSAHRVDGFDLGNSPAAIRSVQSAYSCNARPASNRAI